MSKAFRIVFVIVAVVLTAALAAGMFAGVTFSLYKTEKKAVIILPGLFASGLYDEATGKAVWDPFESIDLQFTDIMKYDGSVNLGSVLGLLFKPEVIEQIGKLTANDFYGAEDGLFTLMAMNEDGTPAVNSVKAVPWTSDLRQKYGVAGAQKEMYESLNAQYGSEYNVEIFNYDFRLDNRCTAELLEQYINAQGYKEVILVSHSNGGQVAALYLARSEENRNKVKKYISYNAPYYGSFSAISILENVQGMVSGVMDLLSALPDLQANIETIFNNQFIKLINMWAPYQLLPTYDLLAAPYDGEQAGIYIDGERMNFSSNEDLLQFYCSRPWAKTTGGDLRVQMSTWIDYTESIKVTMPDGSKVISTSLVDTVYFTGDGVLGTDKVYYETQDGDTLKLVSEEKTTKGDGTVLYSSAVAMLTDASRIRVLQGVNHYGVNTGYNIAAKEATFEVLDAYITERQPLWYETVWNFISKNLKKIS